MNLPLARLLPDEPAAVAGTPERPRSRPFLLRVLGPAFVAAIAFIDPGNVATNATAGADYGYRLLWAVVAASSMAATVQYLAAKLAAATGRSLAQMCRDEYRTPVRLGLWLVAELVVVMTDLAELVGGAIALNLLFGIPPFAGGVIVTVATLLILQLRRRGRDAFPAVVVGLLFAITLAFGFLLIRAPLRPSAAVAGLLPRFAGGDSTLIACGIIGATVMPHALFLHSSLVTSLSDKTVALRTPAMLRFLRRDVFWAMGLAGVLNGVILIVATQLPAGSGASLSAVHAGLAATGGAVYAAVFAVALLASGLASACAGVYSGQAVMQGFLHRRSSVLLQRVVSGVPSLLILALLSNPTQALVLSQVALAFGLPFALIPLIVFTSRRSLMGSFVNRRLTVIVSVLATAAVLVLNLYVLSQSFGGR